MVEISYSQDDLASLGVVLSEKPSVVSVDFSTTLIADPNIEPSLNVDEYYAIMISRRGSNKNGSIGVSVGYYKPSRKKSNGQDLNPQEQFGRQDNRFIEYDPYNSSYVDYHDLSMWIKVHSDTVEITAGHAYSDDGYPISVQKTMDFVGSTKIPYFLRNIPLSTVAEGEDNYIALYRRDKFTSPATHPRTGNFVNTKIEDAPAAGVLTGAELDLQLEDGPLLLARVTDRNVRSAQEISGKLTMPGMLDRDFAILINPSSDILNKTLINRVFSPDLDCECNSLYRIIEASCESVMVGDLDGDDRFTNEDISLLLDIVGNTLNTPTTERSILGGEISLVDYLKSDMNDDGTVDGADIELLEDAVDGYVNFSKEETFKVLTLRLENILEKDDFPELFDSSNDPSTIEMGAASTGSDEITFSILTDEEGLSIRPGDKIVIESGSPDSGIYEIYSKLVDLDALRVTVSVFDENGQEVLLSGSSNFNVKIISGTRVNMLADNMRLSQVPFVDKNWSIFYSEFYHSESLIDVCDLRRFVETSLIEESSDSCRCETPDCIQPEICSPQLKNQKILPNDLFIPNGEILSAPGVPYHGDIEFANISIPLPPGSIDDCQVNLYANFIKSYAGTCKTASGYPAMTYSDGTYVGCEDSGGASDLTKGRVKITQCIASLYVDALIDGYAVDGYADESDSNLPVEIIGESFVDYSYPNSQGFSEWTIVDPSGGTYFTISAPSALNSPATFLLETINSSKRSAGITYPSTLIDPMAGDFVVDFTASRTGWASAGLLAGEVRFFSQLTIVNGDGTTSTLNLGWRLNYADETEMFYSGQIADTTTGGIISDFDRSIIAADDIGDLINFRFRRTNEAVFGMYYDKTLVSDSSIDGKYSKIGSAPSIVPGLGDAKLDFLIEQSSNPNAGQIFAGKIHSAVIRHTFSSEDKTEDLAVEISRNSLSEISRATFGFPFDLTQRTNIVSARVEFKTDQAYTGSDSFNMIPLEVLNADNLGTIIDYPSTENVSIISSFSPGALSAGDTFSVDVTPMAIYFLSRTGHLPGFAKAFILEPSSDATSALSLSSAVTMVIEYEEISSGVIFKVGASLDPSTGIVSLDTKNILYDSSNVANRTTLNFGVYLKKSGFANKDVTIGIQDLARLGIGTCSDETVIEADDVCFFIAGSTATGTFVEGPMPCFFHLP